MSFSDKNEIKRLLKEQLFYNVAIEKPNIKHLNNVNMLKELPFHNELNIVKTEKHLKDMQESIALK